MRPAVGARVLAVVAVVAGAVAPLSAFAATNPPAQAGQLAIQLVNPPSSARNDPRARAYIVDQVEGGTTLIRRIRVTNPSPQPVHISLYAGAATIARGHLLFAPGHDGNELTSWTTLSPARISLDPGAAAQARVRIAVPPHTPAGERYAVIWAEEASSTHDGITAVNRVGIRTYLDVGGTLQPTNFDITRLQAIRDHDGHPRVVVGLHNTGARAVDVLGTVRLSDGPAGQTVDPILTTTATIAPGGRAQVQAAFDPRLPDGPWLASVSLASGTLHHDANATITFPTRNGSLQPPGMASPASATPGLPIRFWWSLGGFGLALAALLLLRKARRAERAERVER